MEPCSRCSRVSSQNQLAMWRRISGYHPSAGYTKGKGQMIPEYTEHQGKLCVECMKTLGGWPIQKLTDLRQPKKKVEKPEPLSLWDAFH